MAYTLEISVRVFDNGQDVPGSPFVFQTTVAELDTIQILKPGPDGVNYYSFSRLDTVNCWLVTTDQDVLLGFLGANMGLQLQAGGLILMAGVNMAAGAIQNLLISNPGSTSANITGFEAGE